MDIFVQQLINGLILGSIYALIALEVWMQTFIDRPGVEVTL